MKVFLSNNCFKFTVILTGGGTLNYGALNYAGDFSRYVPVGYDLVGFEGGAGCTINSITDDGVVVDMGSFIPPYIPVADRHRILEFNVTAD
jgi:hypothetical protein